MNDHASRTHWLLFLALGFMWGSSYLFIKLAVDDFGTFTLVALRLAVGAALLWIVIRMAGQALPRERRIYGHLVVMAVVNIVIPFALITWAEQSVDSSLAAILTSAVPLFAIVIAPLFLHDEPIRVNGVVGLAVGFVGVVVLTSNDLSVAGSDLSGEFALLGAALSYAVGAVYARRNMRGVPPMIPAVFQVTFAMLIAGTVALVLEHPWDARPDGEAVFSILWLGILGSGFAYLAMFRLLAAWGATRTTLVAYEIPVVGIVLGFLVLQEPIDVRLLIGTGLVVGGVALVNSRFGRKRLFGRVPPVEAT
ncbi:MAG TPA: DMT family transporter [Candidatus Limnocylindrales bacterium]|nr:DMT family transporter [Candidatus Limnocylindrales bacterium]